MQKGFDVVNLHGTASAVIAVPTIGENGNWFIGNNDMGVSAQGPQGDPGPVGGSNGDSGTPIGTVISYMGTKAPDHYLICDGKELNIDVYPALSDQIIREFGIVNYFGGDGVVTFAVPDLRNEFLRGYHGEAIDTCSDSIGKHQDGTVMPRIYPYTDGSTYVCGVSFKDDGTSSYITNIDKAYVNAKMQVYKDINLNPINKVEKNENIHSFTLRPTNVAVLYCIKFE